MLGRDNVVLVAYQLSFSRSETRDTHVLLSVSQALDPIDRGLVPSLTAGRISSLLGSPHSSLFGVRCVATRRPPPGPGGKMPFAVAGKFHLQRLTVIGPSRAAITLEWQRSTIARPLPPRSVIGPIGDPSPMSAQDADQGNICLTVPLAARKPGVAPTEAAPWA